MDIPRLMIKRSRLFAIIVPLSMLVIGLGIIEVVLSALVTNQYFVWPPHQKQVFRPYEERMPGVHGDGRFTVNRDGVRGDPFSPDQDYRILAVGGSTTECLYLDDSEAWPRLLQDHLNDHFKEKSIWVGNVGKSGHDTRHHVLQVRELLKQYPRIDLVLLLVGVNDLHLSFSHLPDANELRPSPQIVEDEIITKAFSVHPHQAMGLPFYKRTEIWNHLRGIKRRFDRARQGEHVPVQDLRGEAYGRWQLLRENAEKEGRVRHDLPDLSPGLNAYAANIRTIIDEVKGQGARPVFLTQPSLWTAGLPEKARSLLWLGGLGRFQVDPDSEYYSIEVLTDVMAKYNSTLLEICAESDVACFNLAAAIPRTTEFFFDDVHFNEEGARRVANFVTKHLVETGSNLDR